MVLLLMAVPLQALAQSTNGPLVLTMEASPDPVRPGGTVSFTITATNSGDADLAEVVVRALLPGYIVILDAVPFGARCPGSSVNICGEGEALRWELGALQAGQSRSVSYAVRIKNNAPEGALISSTANVYAEGIGASVSADVVVDATPETTPVIERTDPEVVTGSVCSQALTIFGRGFTSGSAVTLSNYDTAETFTDVPIASQSSSRITIDYLFPITPSTWAVEVTDPDGRPSGEFVFEVTEPSEGDAPPAVPTALSAEPGDKEVTLSWSASTECDLKEYRLYRGISAQPTSRVATIPKDTETYTDTGLSNGQVYYYRLTAVDEAGNESDYTGDIEVTPVMPGDNEAPAKPAGLTASASGNQIELEWTANSENDLQEYRLYRSTDPDPTDQIATILKGTKTYTDADVVVEQTYYYRLRAVDTSGNESEYSDDAIAKIDVAPAAPTGLTATAESGTVTLKWTANAEGDLQEYRLYRGTSPEPADQIATVTAGTETYPDDNLPGDGTYYYRLKAVDVAGNEGAFSDDVSVTYTPTAVALAGEVPETSALGQNYPNPFNPATTINYDVAEPADVRVLVHNLLGKTVAVLVDKHQAPGRYEVTFDASGLASGVYLYTLRASDFTQTKRLVLLK